MNVTQVNVDIYSQMNTEIISPLTILMAIQYVSLSITLDGHMLTNGFQVSIVKVKLKEYIRLSLT